MDLWILTAIIALAILASLSISNLERTAKNKEYKKHRLHAWTLFIILTVVVIALEVLIRLKVISFAVPPWLYWTHVTPAVLFYLVFLTKGLTAIKGNIRAHIWLSKPMWGLWYATAATAVAIGLWNAIFF